MNNPEITTHSTAQQRDYRNSGFWQDETIYRIVQNHAGRAPDRFAARDRYRRLTYRQLVSAADHLAADLWNSGVKPGQQVAVWLPNRVETVIAVLACSRNRYVCCPSLHRNHTVAEVMGLLERFHAAALISEEGYGADAERYGVDAELARLGNTPVLYSLQPLTPENAPDPLFDGYLKPRPAAYAAVKPAVADPDTLVYLALTSGTTGMAKGVMHSDNTLLANARAIAADWHFNAASVIYTLSPLSHNLGFGAMVSALFRGAEIVLSRLAPGESLVHDLLSTGATFIYGVPAHAIDLLQELREPGTKAPGTITGFRISGAQVPAEVAAELLEHGITPQTGYGMTEAHSHNYTLPGDTPERITGTAGRACPGYRIKIWSLDDKDMEMGAGETGQIGGKGASLMLGYYEDEEATASSLNSDGWFMTGDIGSLDEDGYLYIKGRIKDVIIRGGHNIYPARIEQLAARHPHVDKAAAIALSDERLGEKVCLVIKPADGTGPEPREILEHLEAEGLSKYDMPEYLVETDDMPMTPGGKVIKRDLLALISAGRINPQPVGR